MRSGVKTFGLVICGALGVGLLAQESDLVTRVKDIQGDIRKETTIYQELENKGDKFFLQGNEEFFKNQYKEAVDNYLEAITIYKSIGEGEDNPDFRKKISTCREQISKTYFNWSEALALQAEGEASSSKFTEAIKLCREAILIYPDHKKKLEKRIARYEEMQKTADRQNEVQETRLIKNKEEREYNIQLLLKQARLLTVRQRLQDARDKYDEILVQDPYRIEAIQGKQAVNLRISKAGEERFNKVGNMEAVVEALWKWAMPLKQVDVNPAGDGWKPQVPKALAENKIQQKLKSIVIPRIDFEDVTIPTAIKYIREQSKVHDPEGEGVNIYLRLARPEELTGEGAAPGAAPRRPTEITTTFDENNIGEEGGENYDGPATTAENTLNFALNDKTLQEAIYFLCRAANLRMRVEKYAVVVASHNIPLDDLETKIFPLELAALSSIGGGSDPEQLMRYFKDRGIRFPEGAKVVFDPKISRLIATNTVENLREIELAVLNELNQVDPMVQIQAKFVEIEQTDLKELGFNYALSRVIPEGESTDGKLEFGENSATLLRSLPASEYNASDQLIVFERSWNNYNFGMAVNAIDQADNKDILSSPRITTMNGQRATIRMVRLVWLPDDYSDPTEETHNASNDSSTSFTVYMAGSPEFEEYELGVTMDVTPSVDLEEQTITLRVAPMITDHTGWTAYTYKANAEDSLSTTMKKPIISERRIDTNITIKDGETIVLGGIIKDATNSMDDKIPILGDIPIVGRLFQSKMKKSIKTNLLIFLHCRLIKPDGSPFFPENIVPRGLPTFRAEQ